MLLSGAQTTSVLLTVTCASEFSMNAHLLSQSDVQIGSATNLIWTASLLKDAQEDLSFVKMVRAQGLNKTVSQWSAQVTCHINVKTVSVLNRSNIVMM
jgi:hypothetical protein